ncbi:hypothetical protein BC829DRAFT_52529 [Chytridium lagenaria]|nr:hypothetical protein BC829DRAFT_52529 [Chytridium lagenaria]
MRTFAEKIDLTGPEIHPDAISADSRTDDQIDDNVEAVSGDNQTAAFLPLPSFTSTVEKLEELADTAEDFLDQVGTGITSFLASAISISTPGVAPSLKPKNVLYDRKTAAIAELRKNPSRFIEDLGKLPPQGSADTDLARRFADYRKVFSVSNYSPSIARLLNDDEDFEKLHKRIVPSQVTNDDFWLRYFFHVSEIERDEEARKRLLNAAPLNEEEVAWESEDEPDKETVEVGTVQPTSVAIILEDKSEPQPISPEAEPLVLERSSGDKRDVDTSESSYEIVSGQEATPEVQASIGGKKDKGLKTSDETSDWGDDWE